MILSTKTLQQHEVLRSPYYQVLHNALRMKRKVTQQGTKGISYSYLI